MHKPCHRQTNLLAPTLLPDPIPGPSALPNLVWCLGYVPANLQQPLGQHFCSTSRKGKTDFFTASSLYQEQSASGCALRWLRPGDVLAVFLSLRIWFGMLGAENLPGKKQVPFLKLNLMSCRCISTEPLVSSRCPSSLGTPRALTCHAGDAASGRVGPSIGKIITAFGSVTRRQQPAEFLWQILPQHRNPIGRSLAALRGARPAPAAGTVSVVSCCVRNQLGTGISRSLCPPQPHCRQVPDWV